MLGKRLVAQLLARGDAVTVFSRDPAKARASLGGVEALALTDVGAAAFSRLLDEPNLISIDMGGTIGAYAADGNAFVRPLPQ